jgi:hypothetical protein
VSATGCELAVRNPAQSTSQLEHVRMTTRDDRSLHGFLCVIAVPLFRLQAAANCLCLEVECTPELVARVRCVVPQRHLLAFAVPIFAAAARLDVVLPHETDDVDDLNGHVTMVVTNAGYPGHSVPVALDLWPGKPVAVSQETQAIRRYLNERRPLPHKSSIPSLRWPHHVLPRLGDAVGEAARAELARSKKPAKAAPKARGGHETVIRLLGVLFDLCPGLCHSHPPGADAQRPSKT